jgi:pimeloyl-ACP methyl ester carboxylesterase
MLVPDFTGSLEERMEALIHMVAGFENLVLVGSSFGGLMAAVFALDYPGRVNRVILLAPALNFAAYSGYLNRQTQVPARLFIGRRDGVCPPDLVIPAARRTFTDIDIHESDDDHLLKNTFSKIDWQGLLAVGATTSPGGPYPG